MYSMMNSRIPFLIFINKYFIFAFIILNIIFNKNDFLLTIYKFNIIKNYQDNCFPIHQAIQGTRFGFAQPCSDYWCVYT